MKRKLGFCHYNPELFGRKLDLRVALLPVPYGIQRACKKTFSQIKWIRTGVEPRLYFCSHSPAHTLQFLFPASTHASYLCRKMLELFVLANRILMNLYKWFQFGSRLRGLDPYSDPFYPYMIQYHTLWTPPLVEIIKKY